MTEVTTKNKPLGGKCYGSIPHLPGSRLGIGDHHCHEGQARICTIKARDRHDKIIVQQKYDGSNVGVANVDGELLALTRAGYLARTSPYEQHWLWADWVDANIGRFQFLRPGERLCGEWLAQAHGTRYNINCIFEPFVAFDLITVGTGRMAFDDFIDRLVSETNFSTPSVIQYGPTSIDDAMAKMCNPWALDPLEGVVYRVERKGKVDFLAKYVRPDKADGIYLPEISGKEPVWNWRPSKEF